MNLLKPLENAIKNRIKRLNPNELKIAELVLKIIAGVLCLAIFVCGYWFGSINLDPANKPSGIDRIEKDKLIFQFCTTLLVALFVAFVTFLNTYFEAYKEKHQNEKVESEQKYRNEKVEIEKRYQSEIIDLKRKRDDDSSYRKEQELEFLSIFDSKKLNDFNFETFCKPIVLLLNTGEFKKALHDYKKKLKGRDEALQGLSECFVAKDKKGNSFFHGLVGQACNHALNIQAADEWVRPFYSDIIIYIKGWLFLSIKYGVNLQTKPFYQKSLGDEGIGRYNHKETYIEAIKFIKESLEDEAMQRFFPTPDSRIIVDEYLNNLIHFLELG
jgi:hypothetical protein